MAYPPNYDPKKQKETIDLMMRKSAAGFEDRLRKQMERFNGVLDQKISGDMKNLQLSIVDEAMKAEPAQDLPVIASETEDGTDWTITDDFVELHHISEFNPVSLTRNDLIKMLFALEHTT